MTELMSPDGVNDLSAELLQAARARVSEFVLEQSAATTTEVGFEWLQVPDAPSTFTDLQAAYAWSAATGEPLPVSDEHSEAVMFTDPSVNYALRFWHDVHHVQLNLSFGLVDELELALWLLSVAQAAGIAEGSVDWRLLHADFVGQVYLLGVSRHYPLDQWRFAEGCVRAGLDARVAEARRQP